MAFAFGCSGISRPFGKHAVQVRGTRADRVPQTVCPASVSPLVSRQIQRATRSSGAASLARQSYNFRDAKLRQVRGASLGLYQRSDSRFWWMSYTMNGEQRQQSTKTTCKELANSILKQRESEIVLGLFKVGWAGERMTFEQLVVEFERSHFASLAENTVKGHRVYLSYLKAFFGTRKVSKITAEMVEEYRDQRRQQRTKRNPNRTVKGASVNRDLECLKCVFDLAVRRKYIPENPAASVKHFNELRERPVRRMLSVEEEIRILETAPPYLRVAIILLSQTGGRTYSEGLSLRWDQVDLDNKLIRLGNNVKTPGSTEPIPLSDFACAVLQTWKKEQASLSPYLFPSPRKMDWPISVSLCRTNRVNVLPDCSGLLKRSSAREQTLEPMGTGGSGQD